jgi:hypothetical protein
MFKPFFLLVALFVPPAFADNLTWTSESLPAYDQLFQRTNGWIGADGDFTATLDNGTTLWLFSDTFVGKIADGRRQPLTMINNSAAWQHGVDPATTSVEFFHRRTSGGRPQSIVTPVDGKGWFWIYGATMADGKLFMFLPQLGHSAGVDAFSFHQIGEWLGEVTNPLAPPTEWQIVQSKIPFAQPKDKNDCYYGSSLVVTNGFIYIFGARRDSHSLKMILARAPETSLADFSTWRFRTRKTWSTNAADAADLCDRMATEFSVSWLPALGKYVLICTKDGLSDEILLRTAPDPWGPWSDATVVYHCPEMKYGPKVFCYSAKAHPMLATQPDELIVTYAANSLESTGTLVDPRLYWPRFVRVRMQAK